MIAKYNKSEQTSRLPLEDRLLLELLATKIFPFSSGNESDFNDSVPDDTEEVTAPDTLFASLNFSENCKGIENCCKL